MEALGQTFSEEQFADLCFEFGIELDEVVTDDSGEVNYKIDIPANRYDLLCLEGLVRSLLIFQGRMKSPHYRAVSGPHSFEIRTDTKRIRPFLVAAVLPDITFTQSVYDSFIDLQEKLHQNIGRRRSLVAIGTHDLDSLQGPFVYDAVPPDQIRFRPLGQSREFTAPELMQLYSGDSHLKPYLPLIRDSPVYPLITDSRGTVLSMPPIINGEHSRISLRTRNVLIECTATDLRRAEIVLSTIVCMFSQYCKQQYQCQHVSVRGQPVEGGRLAPLLYPRLSVAQWPVEADAVARLIGVCPERDLPRTRLAELLTRMGHSCDWLPDDAGGMLRVAVPPTRQDVLDACDLAEDAAIAYGYNNIVKTVPSFGTVAVQQVVNKLSDQLRHHVAQAGFTEALTFSLCARDDIASRMLLDIERQRAVHVANPKALEFQVVRTSLVPGLLKTLSANRSMPAPLRVFECSDVVLTERTAETGAVNRRHLAAVYCARSSGFEVIHGLLDRLMQLLEVGHGEGYRLVPGDVASYLPGRCAEVMVGDLVVGQLGVLHPNVVTNFELTMPCSALEINIEPFV